MKPSIVDMDLTDRIKEIRREEGRAKEGDRRGVPKFNQAMIPQPIYPPGAIPTKPFTPPNFTTPVTICDAEGHDIGINGRCHWCGKTLADIQHT